MTGSDIVARLLSQDAAILALVPIERIKQGSLPETYELPALLVRHVGTGEFQTLRRGPKTRTTDRISVTVIASSYRQQNALIDLVKACCAGRYGALGGAENVAILTAGKSPDMRGENKSFEQTQLFRVSFDA